MPRNPLLSSVSFLPEDSPGGIIATVMRHLANAAPTATGATLINPDGTVGYISREEAERFVFGLVEGVRQ
jgi:hypothetical protein